MDSERSVLTFKERGLVADTHDAIETDIYVDKYVPSRTSRQSLQFTVSVAFIAVNYVIIDVIVVEVHAIVFKS